MQSQATTVARYLQELPPERRRAIEAVRAVILANLDADYEEGMQYGMIGYRVPHRVFPAGYHCDPKQPLPFACVASQKNHMSLYLMSAYGEGLEHEWLRREWAKTGKKLDMGKCCIRFKRLEDLALEVIGEAVRRVPAKKYIAQYQAALAQMGRAPKTAATAGARDGKRSRLKAAAAQERPKTGGERGAKRRADAGRRKRARSS
jgi:hypothetical protein